MRDSRGFTLIELLFTLVVIGVLATVAILHFRGTKEKVVDTAARSDLRNAMTAQEAFYIDNQMYATALSALPLTTSTGVALSGGASASGYRMSARHAGSSKTWSIVMGGGTSADGLIQ